MSGNPYTLTDSELERLLAEDAPCGDATSFALGIGDRPGRLVFRARQAMIVCASEEARRMGELHGLHSVGEFVPSGTRLTAGDTILQLEKWPVAAVAALHDRLPEIRLAAAGGINAGNAADYARAGAAILVTSAPYSATPRDVSVSITAD